MSVIDDDNGAAYCRITQTEREEFPRLANWLAGKRLSHEAAANLLRPTSWPDNDLKQFNRLINLSTMVRDQQECLLDEIRGAPAREAIPIARELHLLLSELHSVVNALRHGLADQIATLGNELARVDEGVSELMRAASEREYWEKQLLELDRLLAAEEEAYRECANGAVTAAGAIAAIDLRRTELKIAVLKAQLHEMEAATRRRMGKLKRCIADVEDCERRKHRLGATAPADSVVMQALDLNVQNLRLKIKVNKEECECLSEKRSVIEKSICELENVLAKRRVSVGTEI